MEYIIDNKKNLIESWKEYKIEIASIPLSDNTSGDGRLGSVQLDNAVAFDFYENVVKDSTLLFTFYKYTMLGSELMDSFNFPIARDAANKGSLSLLSPLGPFRLSWVFNGNKEDSSLAVHFETTNTVANEITDITLTFCCK